MTLFRGGQGEIAPFEVVDVGVTERGGSAFSETEEISTIGASLVVLIATYGEGAVPDLTVSHGDPNDWTERPANVGGDPSPSQQIWYLINPPQVSNFTARLTRANLFSGLLIASFSGGGTPVFEVDDYDANVNPLVPGPITPATPGSLVITATGRNGPLGTLTMTGTEIELVTQAGLGGSWLGQSSFYMVQESPISADPSWLHNGNSVGALIVFNPG